MTSANWKPMHEAPKDRRILLMYKKQLFPGVNVVAGRFDYDKSVRKSHPFWTNDLVRLKGITLTRLNQPDGWMELPEAANNGETI